ALAERRVDDRGLVDAELHAPALDFLDGTLDVERDRPGLRVRHQAATAEDLAQLADEAHRVGCRDRDVELEPARLDLLDQVLAADLVGTGAQCLLGLFALGEDRDPDLLAGPVREDDRAADHLVGVARVDPELEMDLHRGVEGDERGRLGELDSLERLVDLLAIDERGCLAVLLSVLSHAWFLPVGRVEPDLPLCGLSRAGVRPASGGTWLLADDLDAHAPGGALDLAHRALDVVGVEVGHLDPGDLADLVSGDPADALALGRLRALLDAGC